VIKKVSGFVTHVNSKTKFFFYLAKSILRRTKYGVKYYYYTL